MTGTVPIVAGQICVMFVLMAAGFVLYRRGGLLPMPKTTLYGMCTRSLK